MAARDVGLALLVVVVWGANFTVIKIGLDGVPPMVLAAVRYVVVALPAVFFVPRPNIRSGLLILYGMAVGVGQFGALFYAMHLGMPAGLASVVLQSQAFLTPLFAFWFLGEGTSRRHGVGMVVAALGLVFIALHRDQAGGASGAAPGGIVDAALGPVIPLAAVLLTVAAAASWALSNIVVRVAVKEAATRGEALHMPGLVVWSALVPPIPFFLLALPLHGGRTIVDSLTALSVPSIFAVAYIAYAATHFGYVSWSSLLAKYPAGTVAPFSLLVPVTGLLTSSLVLSERLTPGQWVGSGAVALGLIIFAGGVAGITGRGVRTARSR